jgi:cbb3-type cytochrome c oxidase subunit III
MKKFGHVALLTTAIGVSVLLRFQVTTYAASDAQNEQAPAKASTASNPGAEAYANHCAICHGDQREGILPSFPPLLGITRQMKDEQIIALIHSGKGRMPAFPTLPQAKLASLVSYLHTTETSAPQMASVSSSGNQTGSHSSGLAEAGSSLFQQNCAFCHGRDAMGGETGPDLTRSKLVLADKGGDKISEVVRDGRPEKKMPAFNFSSQELLSIVAFIHSQEVKAVAMAGKRRGVDVSDLQTGNVEAGKQYFNGAGGCAKCHSPSGDLAGIAKRYEGLQLEERMLYPRDAKSTATVTLASGQKVKGTVAYQDEFTIGIRDKDGVYHSWPTRDVKYAVDSPVDAHVELFSKYTDDDIHNLMAYLQTLR